MGEQITVKQLIEKRIVMRLSRHDHVYRHHDTSILHHAFISIFIALWAVVTHYISVLMAILLFYKVYHE